MPMAVPDTSPAIKPRVLLMGELERRSHRNPKYSLRAFARAIGLTPAGLSLVLSGKRQLTLKTGRRIVDRLGLEPNLKGSFLSGCKGSGRYDDSGGSSSRTLELDQFALIADWYHFAILSLIDLKEFKSDFQWIASRLGITLAQAKAAVDRLERMGILDTSSRRWRQVGAPILLENQVPAAAARTHQKQVLEKALESLENDPFESREISSMTFAVDPAQMPLAADEIRKFRVYLMNLLGKKGNPREVYHLAVQFYPVTRRNR
jgi:hypothetical protein